MKYDKANDSKTVKRKAENEKIERKIPDIYKRDDSPEQNGEDF